MGSETFESLVEWFRANAPDQAQGVFLDGDGVYIEYRGSYCQEHGERAARLMQRLVRRHSPEAEVSATWCWSGDEELQLCRTCGCLLDTGGLVGWREPLEGLEEMRKAIARPLDGKQEFAEIAELTWGLPADPAVRARWMALAKETKAAIALRQKRLYRCYACTSGRGTGGLLYQFERQWQGWRMSPPEECPQCGAGLAVVVVGEVTDGS